jgi:predicted phage terminase large subunit-like protein
MACATPTLCASLGGCDCPEPTDEERRREWLANATPEEVKEATAAERAYLSLSEFFRQAFVEVIEPSTPYAHGEHVDAICDHIQWQLEERARAVADPTYVMQCQDLLVNMPPRMLKTIIIQVAAVAWAWLHWPELRVLCLSTNPKVSTEAADSCRLLIRSDWYQRSFQPAWQIRDDKDGVTDMKNDAGGRRTARGWDANVVGEGADWRIIDDPNDPDDVHSEVKRENVATRWTKSIANRKTSPRTSITTGIQQRVHIEDWSSARLAEGGWVHLCLRQEYLPTRHARTSMPVNAGGRYEHGGLHTWRDWRSVKGETLHPARFSAAWCAKERVLMGTLSYEAQHNQDPRLTDGNLFKRAHWKFFRWHDSEPTDPSRRPEGCNHEPAVVIKRTSLEWIATSTDAAFTKTDTSDPVGTLVGGGIGARVYLFSDRTMKRDYRETRALILELAAAYPWAAHLIEKKANGDAVVNDLGSAVGGLILLNPEGGKPSRAAACSPRVEAGDVYLLDGAEWLDDFVSELADFPGGSHDDRVDAFTQLLIHYGSSPSVAAQMALARA